MTHSKFTRLNFICILALSVGALTGMIVAASPAWAALKICNETPEQRAVAIGYEADEGWTSEGWWNIAPGNCQNVIDGALTKVAYYYRAAYASENFDGEGYKFCTNKTAFTIVGDRNCSDRGFKEKGFSPLELADNTTDYLLTIRPDLYTKGQSFRI